MRKCPCEEYTSVDNLEMTYTIYDFGDEKIPCPKCKKILNVIIPEHVPEKQRLQFAEVILLRLSNQ